jgi:hypothetical protein
MQEVCATALHGLRHIGVVPPPESRPGSKMDPGARGAARPSNVLGGDVPLLTVSSRVPTASGYVPRRPCVQRATSAGRRTSPPPGRQGSGLHCTCAPALAGGASSTHALGSVRRAFLMVSCCRSDAGGRCQRHGPPGHSCAGMGPGGDEDDRPPPPRPLPRPHRPRRGEQLCNLPTVAASSPQQ